METILAKIETTIIQYRDIGDKLVFDDASKISGMLKDLTANLFLLESYRDQYARLYNSTQHNLIKSGASVSGAEIEAKEQVPELYMLRRLMTSAYKVADAMRTNISFLKNEN